MRIAALGALLLINGCGATGDSGGVTGLPKPASVKILAPSTELYVGQTIQLTATAQDGAGADLAAGDPSWSSTNTAVAQISETGLLMAMAPGSAACMRQKRGSRPEAEQTRLRPSATCSSAAAKAK